MLPLVTRVYYAILRLDSYVIDMLPRYFVYNVLRVLLSGICLVGYFNMLKINMNHIAVANANDFANMECISYNRWNQPLCELELCERIVLYD